MARFSMSEADNYGASSNGSFFTLKDHGDTAKVRFLYRNMDDVEGYAVHEVEVNGKRRYVSCLRDYRDPIDVCPLCAAQISVKPKLFLKVFNEDTKECQIWERGKAYFQRLASLASRYNPLCDEIVEIERNGKKGDQQTTYEFYPIENSQFDLESCECPEPLGTIILDKTAEEMNEYLNLGSFPGSSDTVSQNRSESRGGDFGDRPTGRRTPNATQGERRAF